MSAGSESPPLSIEPRPVLLDVGFVLEGIHIHLGHLPDLLLQRHARRSAPALWSQASIALAVPGTATSAPSTAPNQSAEVRRRAPPTRVRQTPPSRIGAPRDRPHAQTVCGPFVLGSHLPMKSDFMALVEYYTTHVVNDFRAAALLNARCRLRERTEAMCSDRADCVAAPVLPCSRWNARNSVSSRRLRP